MKCHVLEDFPLKIQNFTSTLVRAVAAKAIAFTPLDVVSYFVVVTNEH